MKSAIVMLLAALTGSAAAQPSAQPAPQPAPARPATPVGPSTPAAPGGPDPAAPTTSAGPQVLTLERAVEIAMRQQPSLRQSKAQLEATQGRVDLSRVARKPTVQLGASAGTGSARGGAGTTMGMDTPSTGFFSHSESTALSASASWRIYDFGQTAA